ncbi:MAG: mechanosensitive ion channel [Ketobacteraceae bacterium]|nr:mechanosensitive ion channel [Ketobacteraceae bacterium]
MLPNNTVIMPNSALSQSKVINYYYPTKELSVPVDVGVHYSSDLEHVERVTLEVAREILKSAFIKALHKRYREKGIVIPYPIRAINMEQEKTS